MGYTALLFQPGTTWSYSDGGANWLADVLTARYREDLANLLFRRVFSPLGITASHLRWRSNFYRSDTLDGVKRREFGSGVSANVDAMARFGYLYLRGGVWDGQRILPETFMAQVGKPAPQLLGLPVLQPSAYFTASNHYGFLWWNNGDQRLADVPPDAYWSWGLGESLIVVKWVFN